MCITWCIACMNLDELRLSSVDSDLFLNVLDTTKSDAKRCFRCKAYDHMVYDCPFPRRICWRRVKRHKKEKISEHLTMIPRSSTIKSKKFATNGSRIDVKCHHVNVHMSAEAAVEVNLITDANSVINNNSP